MSRPRSLPLLAFLTLSFVISTAARAQDHTHEFKFKPDGPQPRSVHVAGDFNGWSRDATSMTRGGDNVWAATVKLTEGVHLYKFVVDGDKWVNDPNADKSLEVDDGHGGKNSAVQIGSDFRKKPAAKPNHINGEFVLHSPSDIRDAERLSDGSVRLRLRTLAEDVERVRVTVREPNPKQRVAGYEEVHRVASERGFDVWGGLFHFAKADSGNYVFVLDDGDAFGKLTRAGFDDLRDGAADSGKSQFNLKELPPPVMTPDWSKHAVWYQIFPERFRNGDESNDPGDMEYEHLVPWTHDWWKTAPGEPPGDENFYKGQGNVWKRRYGGDVQGLIQALPYLRSLGVNAIYLNPIFEADSMHKYDASDFRHIDDNFGFKGDIAELKGETDDPATWKWTKSDKLFLDFVDKAHSMGFKVIIDGVFNHVGKSHPFFQDVLKNGRKSKYADWFEITDFDSTPIKYKAWDQENGHLPVFKKDPKRGLAPGPYAHVMAVTKRWLAPDGDPKRGVDGWRLDVPGDIPHPFWIEWRKTVKQAKPDAYITGEIWTWAQPWLKGDQFDAVMNYRWADAAQKFFVNQQQKTTPSEFHEQLTAIAYTYPYQVALANQNLFDSHDTDRFASMFVNPDLAYDAKNRIQDNGPQYRKDKPTPEQFTRMLQAVAVQHAMVGAPMTYYGNETGMWSPDDPSNRQPMVWEGMKFEDPEVKFDAKIFTSFQRAIAMRNQLPQLRLGFFRGVVVGDDRGVYAFARELGDDVAYVVVNRSGSERQITVPAEGSDGKKLIDWLDPNHARLVMGDGTRPQLVAKPAAAFVPVTGGKLVITLRPFTTAVLTKR